MNTDILKNLQDLQHAQENVKTEKAKLNDRVREVFQRVMDAREQRMFMPTKRGMKTHCEPHYQKYYIDEEDWYYDHRNGKIEVRVCVDTYDMIFDDESFPVEFLTDEAKLIEHEREARAILQDRQCELQDRLEREEREEYERLKAKLGE